MKISSMEVTRENFLSVFAQLKSTIKHADFVAIDGEFTGLSTLRNRRVTYETLEEKFDWLCRGTSQMLLVQYGICLFTWNETKSIYEALPLSFYLFPRPYKRNFNDVMFMSQSSSLDFLANNGFDFNKWVHKGISFMSPWQERKARERLDRELSLCAATPIETPQRNTAKVFIPKVQKAFIDSILESINRFIKNNDQSTLDLPSCNPFQRKLIYEIVEEKFPTGLYLESVCDAAEKTKFIRVIKVTEFAMHEMKNESRRKELEYFEEILGFSKVIKLLTEHKKPIIGHNMLFDLFLTVFHFFDNRVSSLRDFKQILNENFPVIFDTKLITCSQPLCDKVEGTALNKLFGCLGNGELPDPCVERVDDQSSEEGNKKAFHQAGFDAFCTGSVFISACKCLMRMADGTEISDRINIDSDIVTPFANRVNIQTILDIPYMDISGPDRTPSRRGVFYVELPGKWTEKDIEDLFGEVCPIVRPIVWVADRCVYVTLKDESYYDDVMVRFVVNKKPTDPFLVLPYAATLASQKDEQLTVVSTEETFGDEKQASRKRKAERSDTEEGEICSDEDGVLPNHKSNKMESLFEAPSEW